jgi:signal peptide peptidase SppA
MKIAPFKKTGPLAFAPQAWGGDFEVRDGLAPSPFERSGSLAIVEICGPLTQHAEGFWDSYDSIRCRVDAAFDDVETSAVVLKIDSPGGDVAGCFELARDLAAAKAKHGKRLVAYADGMAASAAYALASAADEIVVSATSFVGSIGVIETMCDQTAADAAMGLRFALVTSGTRKADGNPHVPISKEAVTNMQRQVDGLADLFFGLVGDMRGARGLTAERAKALQAGMYFGANAVSVGLADRVSTLTELLATAAEVAAPTEGSSAMPKASFYEEALSSLKQAADEGNEMAKKMLALDEKQTEKDEAKKAESEEPKKDGDKPEGKKAEGEEPKKEAKAEADDEKKAKAEADDEKKAQASVVFDLTREVHALKAEREAEKRAKALAELFATRPDFDAKMQATLSSMSLEKIREACTTWPRVAGTSNPRAAAATATGTRGATAGTGRSEEPPTEADFIDRAMGLKPQAGAVTHDRNHLVLGHMTREQAIAHVAKLDAEKAAGR